MAVRKVEKFEPVTLGHIRSHGCRDLLIYCGSINCSYSATMNADDLPDNIVIRALGPKMICTKCGHRVLLTNRTVPNMFVRIVP
jgi:hypothetical protein